jgi:hypothetical protein
MPVQSAHLAAKNANTTWLWLSCFRVTTPLQNRLSTAPNRKPLLFII